MRMLTGSVDGPIMEPEKEIHTHCIIPDNSDSDEIKEMAHRDDYDSPWKEILSAYFQEFMAFFFPEIAREIDWSMGYELLDKELRQITRESEIGLRLADRLVKVWKKNGQEAWVLIHVEVQAWKEAAFGHRVFVYHYRIHDLYNRPVVSLAVLADDNPNWRVRGYEEDLWGCGNTFRFPMVKLLDLKDRGPFLESSSNPFAVVVMAHLRAMETRKDHRERLKNKLILSKSLFQRGWTKQEIIDLYRFIDWIMFLPKDLAKTYHEELVKYEEDIKMPFITTAERIGIERGKKETAINLILLGILTEEQIADAADLTIEEVRHLKQEIENSSE